MCNPTCEQATTNFPSGAKAREVIGTMTMGWCSLRGVGLEAISVPSTVEERDG